MWRTLLVLEVMLVPFAAGAREVRPELSNEVIFNPGTGWQVLVTAVSQVGRGLKEMPLVSTYYYRSSWTRYEPAKEQYESSPAVRTIDRIRDMVEEKGRFFAFRVVTYNAGNPEYQRTGAKVEGCDTAVPEYVFTELEAEGFQEPGGKNNWVPVFWDPVYIERFNKLAEFLGKRYSGHPSLAYVDIGGGNWGEMNLRNTGIPSLDDLSVWREHGLTQDSWHNMIVELVDGYRSAFPNDYIIMARDYASYGKGQDTTMYGVSNDIGFRDDGLGMDYSRAGRRNEEFEKYWKDVPCLFENGYLDWTDTSGPGWGSEENVRSTLEWAVDHCHACIVMVGKGSNAFRAYQQYEHLVREFGKRLGYRLAVTRASFEDPLKKGGSWNVRLAWENLGNTPPYQDYAVEIAFVNGPKTYFRYILPAEKAHTSTWVPGKPVIMDLSIKVPDSVTTGRAAFTVALCPADQPDNVKRRINLAHKTTDANKRALVDFLEIRSGGLRSLSGGISKSEDEDPAESEDAGSYPEIQNMLKKGRFEDALEAVRKAREEGGGELLELLAEAAEDGLRFVGAVAASGEALKGERISVNFAGMRTRAVVVSAAAGGLIVEIAGTPIETRYADIKHEDLGGLAAKILPDEPGTHLRLGRFYYAVGEKEKAATELAKVPAGEEGSKKAQTILELIE